MALYWIESLKLRSKCESQAGCQRIRQKRLRAQKILKWYCKLSNVKETLKLGRLSINEAYCYESRCAVGLRVVDRRVANININNVYQFTFTLQVDLVVKVGSCTSTGSFWQQCCATSTRRTVLPTFVGGGGNKYPDLNNDGRFIRTKDKYSFQKLQTKYISLLDHLILYGYVLTRRQFIALRYDLKGSNIWWIYNIYFYSNFKCCAVMLCAILSELFILYVICCFL